MAIISPYEIKKKRQKRKTPNFLAPDLLKTLFPILQVPERATQALEFGRGALESGKERIPFYDKLQQAAVQKGQELQRTAPSPYGKIQGLLGGRASRQPYTPTTPAGKVGRVAGGVTSEVGQFVMAGKIAVAVLGQIGKFGQYAGYASKLGVPLKDIYKAEKALGIVVKSAPKPWLQGAVQWGIHALPRLTAKDTAGKARELASSMITGGAFGTIMSVGEMKPIVRYIANVVSPYIIKSVVEGNPEEAQKEVPWYAAMAVPVLFAGVKAVGGKPPAPGAVAVPGQALPPAVIPPAPGALAPPALPAPPAGQLPLAEVPPAEKAVEISPEEIKKRVMPEEGKVVPKAIEEQTKLLQSMRSGTGEFETGELYTQAGRPETLKIIVSGRDAEGNVAGDYIGTGALSPAKFKPEELLPLKVSDEVIRGVLSTFDVEPAKPPVKPVPAMPTELEKLAEEARKYESATEFVADSIFATSLSGVQSKALEVFEGEVEADKLESFYNQVVTKPTKPLVEKPILKETKVEQERVLAEARGEFEAEKKTVPYATEIQKFKNFLRIAGEKKGKETGELFREHIPRSVFGISSDEVADALGMSENEFMAGLAKDITMASGKKPSAVAVKRARTKIKKIKSMAEALKLDPKFHKILDAVDKEIVSGPVLYKKGKKVLKYKKPVKYRKAKAAIVKPTTETKAKIAKRKVEAREKEEERLYKEWQDTYKSDSLSPKQALNKSITQIKKMTDQGVRNRLDDEVARVFAPDYRSPEFVFEKFGLKGKVYTPLKEGQEKVSKELQGYTERSNKWWKAIGKNNKVKKKASNKIFKWLDGDKEIQLNEAEQEVANEIKTYLAEWADRLNLPESRRIADYITHIFEPDFEGGKKVFPDELAKILDYITPNKEFNPFLEKRLGAKGYKEDVFEALDAYVYRGSRKLFLDKPLNQAASYVDALPLQASRYTDKFLKNFKNRPSDFEKWLDQNLIQALPPNIKNYLGNRPASKMTRMITSQIYRGTLGFNLGSAMKNLTQFVNTYAELGEKYTAIGYSQLLTRGVQELKDNEVLSDMIIADYKNTALRNSLRKVDSALFWFFETAEKINRGSAYYGAKQKFLDEGLPEEEAVSKAKEIVRKTQFEYGKLGTPLALQTPAGKLMFTLATYPLKQAEYIGGYAKQKEYAKLARYVASSFAIVLLVGDYLGIDYKDVFFKNIMPTLGIVPKAAKDILGPEWKREKATKNILNILTIPGYGQGKKIMSALKGESRTDPSKTYPKGQRRFKIETPKDIITTLLSGEWSASGAEKYLIKIGIKDERDFTDDLLYILTGEKEYAPKK